HRQHQHLKLREFLAHELERLYTVAVRQGHVQQQHVARLLAQQAQRGRARIRLAHDLHVAAFDDDLVQTAPQDRVVVDDDHLDHDASVAPSGSGTGGCAGSSGSGATTVVPLPAAPPKLTSPPRLRARSSIPRSPNDPRLRRSVFSMPRPLSLTLSVTVPASTLSSTPTAVAPACLEMLVSVSRNTLKRALPSSGSMGISWLAHFTVHGISMRFWNSPASHSMASSKPSSSSGGRRSRAMREVISMVRSSSDSQDRAFFRSSGLPLSRRVISHRRSILIAVRLPPMSSCTSRATRVRSCSFACCRCEES